MRSITRLATVATATLLGLTGLGLSTGSAVAAPLPTLIGSAPAAAHSPDTVTFSYAINLPVAVDATAFTTHQAAALPAATTSVTLDGAPVPAAQVSQSPPGDITVHTGAAPTDGLSAGPHTITFTSPIAGTGSASTSSTATLSWTQAGLPGSLTSAPVLVEVNQPDLAVQLTPDSGEDAVGFLGTGQDLDFYVDVTNHGYGAPPSSLTIALPAGLTLGAGGVTRDSDGSPLVCTAGTGSTVICDLGPLAPGAADPTLDIDLTTLPHEPVGSTVAVTVSVAPNAGQGTDANPADNSATAQIYYSGSAKLSYSITPATSSKVVLGQSTKVTLTVHNAGPQTAPQTLGLAIVVGDQLKVTGFTGQTIPLNSSVMTASAVQRAHLLSAPTVSLGANVPVAAASVGTEVLWLVGDIPAGGSATAVLTLKAQALGTARIGLIAFSGAADPNCDQFDCMPTTIALTVVKAPVPVASSSGSAPITAAGGGSAAAGLANTGASTRPAVYGLLFLLAGIGLLFASRRRVRSY